MTQSGWNDAEGGVFVAVFATPQGDGVDRVAVAMNRSNADAEVRLPSPRLGMAWRALIDTHDPETPERWLALADLVRLPARSSLILAEAPTAGGGLNSGPPGVETVGKLAKRGRDRCGMDRHRRRAHDRFAGEQDRASQGARPRSRERSSGARKPHSPHRRDTAPPPALLACPAPRRAARRALARCARQDRCSDRAGGRRSRRMVDRSR